MKKQLIIIGIIVLLMTVSLTGCNESENTSQSDEDRIIGTWVNSFLYEGGPWNTSFIFLSNRTFEMVATYNYSTVGYGGTWRLIDSKLELNATKNITGILTYGYSFSNNYSILKITDEAGQTSDYTKQ